MRSLMAVIGADAENRLSTTVRLTPIQQRSTKRLEDLLDATAHYIHHNGYETLTTAHVAEISGASIGTVYRYFPDRIALLEALITRNLHRATEALQVALHGRSATTIAHAVDALVDVLTDHYQSEKGFRAIRLGDPLDIRPARPQRFGNKSLARMAADFIAKESTEKASGIHDKLEAAVEVADGLLNKAFLRSPRGHKDTIAQARKLAHAAIAL